MVSKKLAGIRLVPVELEVSGKPTAERTKTLQQLVAPGLARDAKLAGVRDVDPTLVTAAVSMGATRGQVSRKVLLPAVLPSVLAGMRVGIVFAMLGVLLAEMFAGTRGMGFLMQRMAMAFKASELFAATLIVSILSIVVVLSLEHLNQRLSRWR